jgi:hypothetical protein
MPRWWRHVGLWPQLGANQATSLLDANICTMSPKRPMAAIPDEIATNGHILCALSRQHKECSGDLGTYRFGVASIGECCRPCVNPVQTGCQQCGDMVAPTVPSLCEHCVVHVRTSSRCGANMMPPSVCPVAHMR